MSRFLFASFAIITSFAGACGEKNVEAIAGPKEGVEVFFALKLVHPENSSLLWEIESGEPIPPDYSLFPMNEFHSGTGEITGEQPIILKKTNLITAEMVETAVLSGDRDHTVLVKLTKKGASRLTHATKQMRLGRDRIAIVFENRCLIAPTVMAILSDQIVVNGLTGPDEAKRLCHLLTTSTQ